MAFAQKQQKTNTSNTYEIITAVHYVFRMIIVQFTVEKKNKYRNSIVVTPPRVVVTSRAR